MEDASKRFLGVCVDEVSPEKCSESSSEKALDLGLEECVCWFCCYETVMSRSGKIYVEIKNDFAGID